MTLTSIGSTSRNVLKLAQRDGKMPQLPKWTTSWTVAEAAQETGYNQEYIRRLIRNDEIEAVKVGNLWLIRAESLRNYLRGIENKDDNRYGPKNK